MGNLSVLIPTTSPFGGVVKAPGGRKQGWTEDHEVDTDSGRNEPVINLSDQIFNMLPGDGLTLEGSFILSGIEVYGIVVGSPVPVPDPSPSSGDEPSVVFRTYSIT